MRVACVAVVGRSNNPLYIQTVGQEDELKFHFIVHTSLDVVDARQNTSECFLGLLYPTEDWSVYGHVTASGAKLILVLDDSGVDANKIKTFLRDLAFLYCDVVSNPFYEIGTSITSSKFRDRVNQALAVFN